jgi:SAM-dependent methyltransferase
MKNDRIAQEGLHEKIVRNYFETTSSRSAIDEVSVNGVVLEIQRLLGDWVPRAGETVLDLGSGMGECCALAVKAGAGRVIGVNLSPQENQLARKCVPSAEFYDSDLVSYLKSTETESVDRIIALNILEHLDKDTLADALQNAARVLRPNGVLIAMTPNATSTYGGMTRYWDITHHIAFTPSSVRQIGTFCGFRRFEFRECGPRPHGVVSVIRWSLWQIIRMSIKFRLLVETASTKGGVYTADMLMKLAKQ